MSGSYVIRAGAVTVNTGPKPWAPLTTGTLVDNTWGSDAGGPANNPGIENDNAGGPGGIFTIRYSADSAAIYVDGVPMSFASLPSGFTPTSASVDLKASHNGPVNWYLQFDPFTESTAQTWIGSSIHFRSFVYPGTIPSILNLFNNGFGLRVDSTSGGVGSSFVFSKLEITGTYDIVAPAFQLPPPVVPTLENTTPVRVGDKIKITGPNLDKVEQIELGFRGQTFDLNIYDDIVYNFIILVTKDEIWFYLPWYIGPGDGPVTVTVKTPPGPGTQFSGSILAGTLQVFYEDASGIYRLVEGQTNDILYFRAGYTTDSKLTMLPELGEEVIEEDFFNMLPYPRKILSQVDIDEDYEQSDFSRIATLRVVVITESVEIPSPFVKTAFIP